MIQVEGLLPRDPTRETYRVAPGATIEMTWLTWYFASWYASAVIGLSCGVD